VIDHVTRLSDPRGTSRRGADDHPHEQRHDQRHCAICAACNNAAVGTDRVRAAGAGLMRRTVLLTLLVALLVPMATTTTTTAPAPTDAVAVLPQAFEGGDPFTGATCDGLERNGSDTVVRVVKKVRGVFVPYGLLPPTFGPAGTPARHEVLPACLPAPHAAAPILMYRRRGPPVTRVHPFA
jgi:hypothetical protein